MIFVPAGNASTDAGDEAGETITSASGMALLVKYRTSVFNSEFITYIQ